MTVVEVCRDLVRRPVLHLVRRWNWKNAILSACLRGAIFFVANIDNGLDCALRVLIVDAAFRLPLAGTSGAIIQAFDSAEPAWAASLAVVAVLPAASHVIEFAVHWMAQTPGLMGGILASVAFSAVSAMFNLFAMRRGVLVVGVGARPLADDLRRLPSLVLEFLLAPLRALKKGTGIFSGWHKTCAKKRSPSPFFPDICAR
jgi:hypothetical protein